MKDSNAPIQVVIPLLNPNEPETLISELHVQEGQHVESGDLLCTVETTKANAQVAAESEGYVVGLRFQAGQTGRAGETLCYLASDPAWEPPAAPTPANGRQVSSPQLGQPPPPGLRITQPALALAQQHGLDLSRLSTDQLVTEAMVRRMLEQSDQVEKFAVPEGAFDPTALIIYGGGGHGKSLIDLARLLGSYRLVGIVDDGIPRGEKIMDLPVLGGSEVLPELFAQGVRLAVNAVGGIGNVQIRIKVFEKLAKAGFVCPALVHPRAFVEASAALSPGVQIFAHAYVGSQTRLGYGCIVNTGAILSHDCVLGDYVNISPGAILAGEVQVGAGALIGMGATINLQARVGAGARIGNGATVKQDVPEEGVVRAGSTWPPA
jgi:sugar O-acyltransferase (sialic acid O-acetyltransferase NeuD family)